MTGISMYVVGVIVVIVVIFVFLCFRSLQFLLLVFVLIIIVVGFVPCLTLYLAVPEHGCLLVSLLCCCVCLLYIFSAVQSMGQSTCEHFIYKCYYAIYVIGIVFVGYNNGTKRQEENCGQNTVEV